MPGRFPRESSMFLWLPLELSMLRLGLAGFSRSVTISRMSWKSSRSSSSISSMPTKSEATCSPKFSLMLFNLSRRGFSLI